MSNNKNNQNNYQNKNNQNNQNNNQNQKNNKNEQSYKNKKQDGEKSDDDHRSSTYLINSVASATDFTGYAVTVPEDEYEGDNLSEIFSDVPVSYKGNEE